jgi:hypothetical protein
MTAILEAKSVRSRPIPKTPAGDERRYTYTSLAGLRDAIEGLEALVPVTAVLVLDDSFSGHLSSLVRRTAPCCGSRLVIVIPGGRLPGLETLGDLAAAGGALGWHEIVLERDAATALAVARATLHDGEDFIVFEPAWHADPAFGPSNG